MLAPLSGGAPKQVVVLLHGYGSDGADLIGLAPHWQQSLPDALFVSPNAPTSVPGMPFGFQWFAIDFNGDRVAGRQAGVVEARPVLAKFLEDLWTQTGLTAADTILAGFSQGAMMALHVGLSLPERVMGIIALSGALMVPQGFGLVTPPVAIIHGDEDQMVPASLSHEAVGVLRASGFDVRFHISPGTGHGISPDGLAFATNFIRDVSRK